MLLHLPETSKQIQQRQQTKHKSIGVWQLRSWRCPCFLWHLLPQVQIRIGLRGLRSLKGVRIPPLSKIGAPDWRCHDRHSCGARPSPVGLADPQRAASFSACQQGQQSLRWHRRLHPPSTDMVTKCDQLSAPNCTNNGRKNQKDGCWASPSISILRSSQKPTVLVLHYNGVLDP